MITIKSIKTEEFESKNAKYAGGGVKLVCEVEIDKKTDFLFLECEKQWEKFLLTERADAFVLLMLPIALRQKHDIKSLLPMTEEFKNNLQNSYIPKLVAHDKSLYAPKIIAETENTKIGGNAVGTSNSLGVDSFYTIQKFNDCSDPNLRITHFYMGAISKDLWGTKATDLFDFLEKRKDNFARYKLVADELGKPLIMTFSNFIDFVCRKHKLQHITVHTYITLAEILCFKKLWKTYHYSSAGFRELYIKNTRHCDCAHYDVETAAAVTVSDFLMTSAGTEASRHEKTLAIADYEPAQKYLRPCFKSTPDMKNCGSRYCQKCLRLLISADVSGNLEKFKNVIDIENFKKHKKKYLRRVVWARRYYPILNELYPLCCEKYPKEMKSMERVHKLLTWNLF